MAAIAEIKRAEDIYEGFLIVHKNLVIVNACDESQALIALNAQTGAEVWRAEASRYEGSYSTPLVAKSRTGRTELIVPLETQATFGNSG